MHRFAPDVCIVGAGLSGLSVATFLRTLRPELSLLVLEQADGPGGAVATHAESGYLAEWGPHGFLDNCAESRELIELAGLTEAVTTAPLGRFVRYVCRQGRLLCIPQKPLAILRQPLIPWTAKLRVLAELWQPPLEPEPTVAQWVAHRFGPALLPYADAVFTGTYAGDIERLAIDAVMPGVRALELEHGSVLKGLVSKMLAARKRAPAGGQRRALPAMTSFQEGMATLPRQLAARLVAEEAVRYGTAVQALHRVEDGWQLETTRGQVRCSQLVLALPINRGLALMAAALPGQAPPLTAIPEARILSVLLGFDHRARIPFGFGYLAPESEHRFTLGALFSSHMFPGRAPQGHHLLEALVGGRRHPERLELSDADLIQAVCADLGQLMPLPPPAYAAVLRPQAAIPQLERGYVGLLEWRQQLQAAHPDLHLCGFGWQGIGINDMIKAAKDVARGLGARVGQPAAPAIKGIYF